MAATTTLLGLVTPTQGTLSGTWGDTVNYGISDYVDISVAGTLTLTNDGAVTLANTTGSSSGNNITSSLTGAGTVTAQFAIVRVTGTLTVAKVVTGPSYSKTYTVVNAATGGIVTFKAAGQTGVSVAVGESAFVYFNGTDYVKVAGTVAVSSFSAGTTGFTPSSATSGAVTLAGTLATTNGGTGLTSFTSGGVVYASSSSVLATGTALTFSGTELTVDSASNTVAYKLKYNGSAVGFFQNYQNSEINFGSTANAPILFYVNNAEQMRLTSTGLGIGNSSPTAKLDVTGTAAISGAVTLSGGTANGVTYLNGSKVLTSGSALVFDGTKLGVGATSPVANVDIQPASTGITKLFLTGYGTSSGPNVQVRRANGTQASPTAALSAQFLGGYHFGGYGTTGFGPSASGDGAGLQGLTAETWTDTAQGASIRLLVTPIGATAASEAVRILSTGDVGIGTSSPTKKLEVANSDALIYGLTVGRGAGAVSTNTAVGASALAAITTGSESTGAGYFALKTATTGTANTAFGAYSLRDTTGNYNSAFGRYALVANSTGASNTAIGSDALYSNTTASNNTAVGYQAGYTNTTGGSNVALGYQALYTNTTGQLNVAVGFGALLAQNADSYNTAVGGNSMQSTTTGQLNAALGRLSLNANTTGSNNVALGYSALQSNTTASNNTAVGYQAGYSNTTGTEMTAIGWNAGYAVTTAQSTIAIGYGSLSGNASSVTGAYNIGIGRYALQSMGSGTRNIGIGNSVLSLTTTSADNVGVGDSSLGANTTGASNVAIGTQALNKNTTASYNTAVGFQAGFSNTTGSTLNAFGQGALYSNTTGTGNAAFGNQALYSTTTGTDNTAIGAGNNLYANTTGSFNVAVGSAALRFNTTASNNTAVGYQAGYNKTTNGSCTFIGYQAGLGVTTGTANTFIGAGPSGASGELVTTGSKNTILGPFQGNQGGLDIRTASNYIVLSDGDGNPRGIFDGSGNLLVGGVTRRNNATLTITYSGTTNNGIALIDTVNSSGTEFLAFQNSSATNIGTVARVTTTNAVVYNTTSDYRLKTVTGAVTGQGARIDALKPIDYLWTDGGQQARGFLAHEFQTIYPNSVTGDKDAVDANGNPKHQSMQAATSEVIADLVAEIQSLRKRLADAGI